jgi:hypothetical protein
VKNPVRRSVVVGGLVGSIVQLLGIARFLIPHGTELDLVWAWALFSLGAGIWMAVLESWAIAKGRSRLFCLLAPLGPCAAAMLARLKGRRSVLVYDSTAPFPRPLFQRLAGLLLVAAVVVVILWATSEWFRRDQWPPKPTERAMRRNEAATMARLYDLAKAQERYRESDWDGDGEKEYAAFLVHLWRSVGIDGRSVEVHLLPRAFGIAMSPAWAVDGYYFTDLRRRQLPPSLAGTDSAPTPTDGNTAYADIDLHHGWAVCATPAAYGETGFVTFVVDQTGKIWGRDQKTAQTFFPAEPERAGWVALTNEQTLLSLQDSISYTPRQ